MKRRALLTAMAATTARMACRPTTRADVGDAEEGRRRDLLIDVDGAIERGLLAKVDDDLDSFLVLHVVG